MKILYIANARIPTEKAHGYQICKMCEEFAAAGADVELIIPTRENNIRVDAFDYYKLRRNFEIKKIKSYDFIRHDKLIGSFGFYLQSFFYFLKLIFKKFDKGAIIYTRIPELVWLFNLRGYKTAYECHDWFNRKKKLALFFLKDVNYLITTNRYIKKEFIDNGFKKDIITAPNGVNLEIFSLDIGKDEAIGRLNIEEDLKEKLKINKVLLYTGSFKTMGVGKGIREILEAIKILPEKNIIFLAVGGSEKDIEYYNKLAEEIGVSEKVFLLPRVEQAELALFQRASDIFLMPFPDKAHYRYHMTPLKIFEYMAGGRPIIASDLPSIREILNENNCLFCASGDSKSLAGKIKILLDDKEPGGKLSRQAGMDVKKFTWQNRAEKIIKYIDGRKQ